ncbi:MAG: AAA family ATPase [Terriglobales bacterium]
MLTEIAACNFKAFGQDPGLRIRTAGLNMLLGPNNSGKTSALDVLALLVQTAREQSPTGLKWSGNLVELGASGEYALHGGLRAPELQIEVRLERPTNLNVEPEVAKCLGQEIGYRIRFSPSTNRYTMHEFLVDGHVLVRNLLEKVGASYQPKLEIRDVLISPLPPVVHDLHVFDGNLFVAGSMPPPHDTPYQRNALAQLRAAQVGLEAIRQFFARKVFLVGAGRAIQGSELDVQFRIPEVGRSAEHTLQVLSTILAKPEYGSAETKIREWSRTFGLADVSSGWAGGSQLHSGYIDALTSTALPLRSAGFGSQQILPIIIQLFASPEGSVIGLEEPETSLHPAAQVQLVRMFAEAVRAGRQLIVTTHSQYVVMALQEEINRGLSPKSVKVYHFIRPQTDSTAQELTIDDAGVLQGWVPSFAEVERRLLSDWMSRVHDRIKDE